MRHDTSHSWTRHGTQHSGMRHDTSHSWMRHGTQHSWLRHDTSHSWTRHGTQHSGMRHDTSHSWLRQTAEKLRNESCHTYERVMSLMWMSHVTHVDALIDTYYHTAERSDRGEMSEWVMAHLWMSHVSHVNESCHARACVNWHFLSDSRGMSEWMSHGTRMDGSCLRCEWVMSHTFMSQLTVMVTQLKMKTAEEWVNESWHTYEWVMSHMWMSHVTHMNTFIYPYCHTPEITHTNESRIWMSHGTLLNESRHTSEWVMSYTLLRWFTYMITQLKEMDDGRAGVFNHTRTHTRTHTHTHTHIHAHALTKYKCATAWGHPISTKS